MTKSLKFEFPEEFIADAEGFLSDDEQIDDEAPAITFPDTLFVCNIPKVAEGEKYDKLLTFMKKKFNPEDKAPLKFTVEMPIDKTTGETGGCAWLKFSNKKEAEKGRSRIHGLKFGGANYLSAILFDDYDSILETGDRFNPTAVQQKTQLGDVSDTKDWLLDNKCREQLLLRFQEETEVHWIDPINVLDAYYCGEREKEKNKVWCDWKVEWSTHGSYLVTCHRPGVCLWGGANMEQKRKFLHSEVNHFVFSSNEQYLVTWNGNMKDSGDTKAYKIWEVLTGKALMEKGCPSFNPSGDGYMFPHFVFSPDSRFFARCTEREVAVHFLPSCAPYDIPGTETGNLRFDNGVGHFQFSPKENVIAVWSPQLGDSPSCLHVVNVEDGAKLLIRTRPGFHAQMQWQTEGEFLAVMLTRRAKIDKATGQEKASRELPKTLDILRFREKNIPVDTIDLQEGIKGLWWEPRSNRFAVLAEHKESPNKTMLLFYSLANNKCEQVASFELHIAHYNQVHWSPDGSYFVVAALGSGDLLWGRLLPETHTLELLQKQEQVSLTNVVWDNSGRYLLTSVIQDIDEESTTKNVSAGQDAGFNLWTFQGRLLHSEKIERLYNANFRPTPPNLLDAEEQKSIRKNLKSHSKRFEQIDDDARNRQRREERSRREEAVAEFRGICETLDANYDNYAAQIGWADEAKEYDRLHAFTNVEEMKEEMISATEEEIAVS